MDAAGDVTAELSQRTVDGMRAMIAEGAALTALLAKKDRTNAEEVDLIRREVGLGRLKADDARARIAALKEVSAEDRRALDGLLIDLDVKAVLDAAPLPRSHEEFQEYQRNLGRQFAAMLKAGKAPTGDQYFRPFYVTILAFASEEKDAATFEKALAAVEAKFADEPRAKPFLDSQRKRLAELKAPADAAEPEKKPDDGM